MPTRKPKKFPPSPEIKRVLSAAMSIGIEIGEVEIEPTRICIRVAGNDDLASRAATAYDLWKANQSTASDNKLGCSGDDRCGA